VYLNIQHLEIWCRYDAESEEPQVAARVKSAYSLSLATLPFVLIASDISKQRPVPWRLRSALRSLVVVWLPLGRIVKGEKHLLTQIFVYHGR
jgi:hypothetical protein